MFKNKIKSAVCAICALLVFVSCASNPPPQQNNDEEIEKLKADKEAHFDKMSK